MRDRNRTIQNKAALRHVIKMPQYICGVVVTPPLFFSKYVRKREKNGIELDK